MQELLGRLRALDPDAAVGLRVIACFDELIIGQVNTRALLSAAASLAGCVAGFDLVAPHRTLRMTPSGSEAEGGARLPTDPLLTWSDQETSIWLERTGAAEANDAIILERLSLALRIRHDKAPLTDRRRDIGLLVDSTVNLADRQDAAARQGLVPGDGYRVLVAPLFATWQRHPGAREDVVATALGPLHVLIVPSDTTSVQASPVGIGQPSPIGGLPRSFATAIVALRLCRIPSEPFVLADDYGGLLEVLAEVPAGHRPVDVDAVASIARHPWGSQTLESVVRTASIREAARRAGVHHSTMVTRLEVMTTELGFDPLDGFGRARLGLSYLLWRLQEPSSLTLPAPTDGLARTS